MTNPCNLCPFRNDDKRLTVHPDRLREFARGAFVCHQTAELFESDDYEEESGFVDAGESSQHCAGSLIFHEHLEWPHQMMRIAERLGMYDRTKLNMDAPVFKCWEEVYIADDMADQVESQGFMKKITD
jgi:hypothetical protein